MNDDTVSLRDYADRRIDDLLARIIREAEVRDQRFVEMETAVREGRQATDEALERALSSTKEALLTASNGTRDALDAANANIERALAVIDKRFESVNEFRQTLADQQAHFIPKTEFDVRFANLENRVIENSQRLDTLAGTRSGQATIGAILVGATSAVSALIAVGAVVFDLLRR